MERSRSSHVLRTSPEVAVLHANYRSVRIVVALTAMLVFGCDGATPGRVRVYPAHGKVLYKGKPLAGALVVLHPAKAPRDGRTIPSPTGRTDDEGNFRLQTYESPDGAPAGDYLVGISSAPEPIGERGLFGAKKIGPAVDPLGGRYADPQTSGLKAHVDAAETTIPPFDLY